MNDRKDCTIERSNTRVYDGINLLFADADIAQDLPAQLTSEEEERSLKRKILKKDFLRLDMRARIYTLRAFNLEIISICSKNCIGN